MMETVVEESREIVESSVPEQKGVPAASGSSVRLAIWLFAAFQFFYMLTSSGRVRTADEYNTLYMTQSIVLRGSTAVPQAVALHNFYGRFDRYGQPRAAYPPAQAVVAAPWYALGQFVIGRLPGVPASAADITASFATSLSSATFSALTVAFFFLLLTQIGVPIRASLLSSLLLGLATPVFAYSALFFSEPLSCAVFLGVALILFWKKGEPVGVGAAAVAGLALGLAAWIRPTDILAVGVFAVAVLARDGKPALRVVVAMCGTAAVGVIALLSRNADLFGSAFEFGYPNGIPQLGLQNTFDRPIVSGLYGFLLSPGKSLFLFAPPAILAIAGLRKLWKLERGVATAAILTPLVYLFFFARYSHWEGGYCIGPRYLVSAIPMLCLGIGALVAGDTKRYRVASIAVLVAGFLVQCISLATSFLEDQAPSRGRYYDAHWFYRFSYSLKGPIELLWKYFRYGQPPTLGLGWDRWFVFLHKAGVSSLTLACVGAVMIAGLAASIIGLRKSVRSMPSAA